ncbi:hypothetical protein EGR_07774 [Echinococcus granulosus]|uniref:Uncharacterized protein n=1 Tax=Echinococcus granulosus TaxID=6210 RepID=W6UA36_ECHGR|nr:hypothetical protein EGR_07774 [Echinococcus granulosus]EUB57381.1 hypothetical protein EGR_07774 [Echinococcus granulosus]
MQSPTPLNFPVNFSKDVTAGKDPNPTHTQISAPANNTRKLSSFPSIDLYMEEIGVNLQLTTLKHLILMGREKSKYLCIDLIEEKTKDLQFFLNIRKIKQGVSPTELTTFVNSRIIEKYLWIKNKFLMSSRLFWHLKVFKSTPITSSIDFICCQLNDWSADREKK